MSSDLMGGGGTAEAAETPLPEPQVLLPLSATSSTGSAWVTPDPDACQWLSILMISRAGRGPDELAYHTVTTVPGVRYVAKIAIVDLVGKLQVSAGDQLILTADEIDLYQKRFVAQGETTRFALKCVDRSDARALITEFVVEPYVG